MLLAFVALVFGLSVVKIRQGDLMEAFDHQPRTSALPIAPVAPEPGPAPAESAPTSDTAAPLTEKTLP